MNFKKILLIVFIAFSSINNSYGRISQNSGSALYMIGAGTLLIGTIITIDSNKWFNRKRTIKTSLE